MSAGVLDIKEENEAQREHKFLQNLMQPHDPGDCHGIPEPDPSLCRHRIPVNTMSQKGVRYFITERKLVSLNHQVTLN